MYEPSPPAGQLRQSEIVSGLIQSVLTLESVGTGTPLVVEITHAFAIVGSQDCDLEQDFTARQENKESALPSILFYEAKPATVLIRPPLTGEIRKRVLHNKDDRYQVLQSVPREQDALGVGVEALGIDFKRYFTLPTLEAYKQLATGRRRAVMLSPYLEHFAMRAALFQCRIALPVDHVVSVLKPS